uniref:Uncharacterized protein n=1 Tax=Arundo donax TaxID=35708 RepID=A0A0A9HCV3_ARUDO
MVAMAARGSIKESRDRGWIPPLQLLR